MNRAWRKSSELAKKTDLILHRRCSTKTQKPLATTILEIPQEDTAQLFQKPGIQKQSYQSRFAWPDLSALFVGKFSSDDTLAKSRMKEQVSTLRNELLEVRVDFGKIESVLEEKGVPLFRMYPDGSAVVELLKLLECLPDLAHQVFDWRRKQVDYAVPMTTDEYAKGIALAGRLKNVDLADEFFAESANKSLKSTSTYNALMGAYMFNGLASKCLSLFRKLKQEVTCSPTIVTYNILLSVFGRLMLVDHMEATLQELRDLNLSPNVKTYNSLIAGYITAWRWVSMEKTYMIMKADNVKPDLNTHLLMLRGYAHSRKLEKMEDMYASIKDHVNSKEFSLIRAMISAYCRSSVSYRVERIEELLLLIPENEYRSWLNVILICVYARENSLKQMENLITKAFERSTSVRTASIMRSIIACYFRNDAVDNLANFVSRAESAGWRLCRSLYHCKMVMYGSQQRLMEMERVIDEMEALNLGITKKTFWILYKAYSQWGPTSKLEKVIGLMYKHGYTTPLYEYSPLCAINNWLMCRKSG